MPEGTVKQGIGASVRRKEDKRFLIGKGNYTPVKLLSKALCTWKRKSFFELIALSVDSGGGILSCF